MLGFSDFYPDAIRIEMSVNYRCADKIIEAAGKVIACNKERFDKKIRGVGRSEGTVLLQGFEGRLSKKTYRRIAERTEFSIRMTLGRLAEIYVDLGFGLYKSILDNIVYLGLFDTFKQVRDRRFNKRQNKKGMTANERSV